jgi:GMP synthase-like glutamine amidotransferase
VSRQPHLLVIDPAMTIPEDQGAAEIAREWPGTWCVLRPCLRPGDGPGPAFGYEADAVAIMGSRASVRDDHAWLRELAAWLSPIVQGAVRRPLLGICFGHQLVAQLAGARVDWTHSDHHEERGFPETTLSGGRLLPGTHRFKVVASHYEAVHTVPAGFRITASRPQVPIDGLEHAQLPIFTWQFHPEGRDRFATKVGLDPAGIDGRVEEESRRLLAAFRSAALTVSQQKK